MLDEQDLLTTAVEKNPPLEIISTFSKGITLTPSHSSGLWILMANCLAEGSSLKSLWLDGFEKLFLLRNVTDLYIFGWMILKSYLYCVMFLIYMYIYI